MAFHWRDGWFFERRDDESVRVYHRFRYDCDDPEHGQPCSASVDVDVTIPPAEWASIVASVSAQGETAASFADALVLHSQLKEEA